MSSSTVPELVSMVRLLIQAKEYNEVERILRSREEGMDMEMRNLKRGYESMKKELDLVERNQALSELEKLEMGERLKKCRNECKGLKEEMVRVYEDQKVVSDRKRRYKEMYRKVEEELNKAEIERKRRVLALSRAMDEAVMEKNKMIGELKRALDEAEIKRNKMLEELKRESDEAEIERNKLIEKLMNEKQEAQQTAELNDQKLLEYEARISSLEEVVASILDVDVSDFRNGNHSSGTSVNGNGEVLIPSRSHSTCNSTKTQSPDLGKEGSGTSDHMQTAEDARNHQDNAETSSGAQSTCSGPQAEINAPDEDSDESSEAGITHKHYQATFGVGSGKT